MGGMPYLVTIQIRTNEHYRGMVRWLMDETTGEWDLIIPPQLTNNNMRTLCFEREDDATIFTLRWS